MAKYGIRSALTEPLPVPGVSLGTGDIRTKQTDIAYILKVLTV